MQETDSHVNGFFKVVNKTPIEGIACEIAIAL